VVWLRKKIVWDGVEAVKILRVDVGIVFVFLAGWVVLDVEELVVEVVGVSYAVLVVALVPDFSCGVLAGREGIASLDVLDAFRR
jgi:hypothetical protein